jgi:hypothetical protein
MSINDDNLSAPGKGWKQPPILLRNEDGRTWPLVYHVVNVRGGNRTGGNDWVALVWNGNAGNRMVALAADKQQETHG